MQFHWRLADPVSLLLISLARSPNGPLNAIAALNFIKRLCDSCACFGGDATALGQRLGKPVFLFLFFFNLATKVRTFERRNVFVRKFPLAAAALRKGPLQKATKTRNKKCN